MRIPIGFKTKSEIFVTVGLILGLVGAVGYTVIFPTMMSISGQDFVSQASTDANNNQNFKDYDSGDPVVILDEVVRMQYEYDELGKTSIWVKSIGKDDTSIRFVCDSNYMNDFGIGSNVIITLEIIQEGQSEKFTCDVNGRLSTTNEYAFVGLFAVGMILTGYGFYSLFRGSDEVDDDEWGPFDSPTAPVAPPVAPPMSAPPAMMPPSDAAIPQQPGASPPAQPLQTPAAAPTSMTITVPPGVAPGQVLTVTMPSGQVVNVQVPPGCAPGSQFTISVTQ